MNPCRAQSLDTLERLVADGRIVDAKLYVDGMADSATLETVRYSLLKGQIYLELYRQSVGLFGIKNNNWLSTGCMAYMDGIGDMAKLTRVPDSLFTITKLCYESAVSQAVQEEKDGSLVLAEDLYYSAEYSATTYLLLSGHAITDTFALRHLGLYFYRKGMADVDSGSKRDRFTKAKFYLQPLLPYKNAEVLEAIHAIETFLR